MRALIVFALLLIICLLTACASAETIAPSAQPTQISSAWGTVEAIARAEQGDAPALAVEAGVAMLAWAGEDGLLMRRWDAANRLSETILLGLPVARPYQISLFVAPLRAHHLLWLDVWPNTNSVLENRLLSAFIPSNFKIERGSIPVSTLPTLRYDALPADDGGVWVAWSGGIPELPDIYITYIDPIGRPRQPHRLIQEADWPALIRASDGGLIVFWQNVKLGRTYHAVLDTQTEALTEITSMPFDAPFLESGDRFVSFDVGTDQKRAYLFWNIVRADGTPQSWWTSGAFDSETWKDAAMFSTGVVGKNAVQTGFNSGVTVEITPGNTPLAWAMPLSAIGAYETLPVAVQHGAELVIVYLRDGQIDAYQSIAPLDNVRMLGLPVLATDIDRHLYLAWAQPPETPDFAAELRFTTTKR